MIDRSKLKNVSEKPDGKITARCPACELDGADSKGEHLVVYLDGKFGCVINQGNKAHNAKILQLVGENNDGVRFTVLPLVIPESHVLMKIGHFGRKK